MNINLFQVLVVVFVLFVVSRAVLRLKDNEITMGEFIFWILMWGIIAFVVFVPSVTSDISKVLGIGRGADFIIYISLLLLFYLVFRTYVKIEKVEQDITTIVREMSLREHRKKR